MFNVTIAVKDSYKDAGVVRVEVTNMHPHVKRIYGSFPYTISSMEGRCLGQLDRQTIARRAAKYIIDEYIGALQRRADVDKTPTLLDYSDMEWNKVEESPSPQSQALYNALFSGYKAVFDESADSPGPWASQQDLEGTPDEF